MADTPTKPKTPIMNFRIPKDLADQVRARAAVKGETVTHVVVQAFERYVKAE